MITKMDEEIKEATDIDGNMGYEFAVLPIGLNRYPYVYGVGNSSSSSHRPQSLSHHRDLIYAANSDTQIPRGKSLGFFKEWAWALNFNGNWQTPPAEAGGVDRGYHFHQTVQSKISPCDENCNWLIFFSPLRKENYK